jgi:hypothetical protein
MRSDSPIHKEVNRFMWIVKGQLAPDGYSDQAPDGYSDQDYIDVHDSYFKRLWGNHENCVHEEGFEEAYKEKYQ